MKRLRAKWPDVVIELRGDAGMAVPAMDDVCERREVQYTFGLPLNPVLQRQRDALLDFERTGQPLPAVHRVLVSGRVVGTSAVGRRQGRSACGGHQSPGCGHQSSRADTCCRRRLTTITPIGVKAKTAIRKLNADWRLIV